ncbi:MAG: site-2 protease family protein [Povalibacter sp.]
MKNYVRAKRLRVCGAPVFLHWSALVVIGGCLATSISDPIVAVVATASYFGMILIHEYGHAWVARKLGYDVYSIRLSVIHGECQYEASHETARDAALIAWGGPMAQFVAAIAVWLLALVPVVDDSEVFGPLMAFFGYLGPLLAMVNLAPSPHLDGARAWSLIPMLWNDLSRQRKKKKTRSRSSFKIVK